MITRPRRHLTARIIEKPQVIPTDYFGRRPDVDACFEMIEHPIPVGEVCIPCLTEITESDRGYLDSSRQTGECQPVHLECDLLLRVGWNLHVVEKLPEQACCPPFDLPPEATIRDLARAALDYVNLCRAKAGLGPM